MLKEIPRRPPPQLGVGASLVLLLSAITGPGQLLLSGHLVTGQLQTSVVNIVNLPQVSNHITYLASLSLNMSTDESLTPSSLDTPCLSYLISISSVSSIRSSWLYSRFIFEMVRPRFRPSIFSINAKDVLRQSSDLMRSGCLENIKCSM